MLQNLREQITRRRALLVTPFAFAGLIALSSRKGSKSGDREPVGGDITLVEFSDAGERLRVVTVPKVVHSKAEWRKLLTAEQYYVTREQGTDTAFTGTYYKIHNPGIFRCICCANALFNTTAKFDSGTGWPSFWEPIARENVRTHSDVSLLIERVEVLCVRCDAHLGHVFNDGPAPTGLRYCIDESALKFVAR